MQFKSYASRRGPGRNSERGCYISAEIDSLWDCTKTPHPWNEIDLRSMKEQPVFHKLKHLTINHGKINSRTILKLEVSFPKWETLTVVVSECYLEHGGHQSNKYAGWGYARLPEVVTLPTEVDGQKDFADYDIPRDFFLKTLRVNQQQVAAAHNDFYTEYPEKKVFSIKWRFQTQVVEKEGIQMPGPVEEDPLKEMTRQMKLIAQQSSPPTPTVVQG